MAQVKKTAVRDAILGAAWKQFSEDGYNGSTLSRIAKAAGVSTANLYVYFPSKLDILYAIYSPWMRDRLTALAHDAKQIAEPRERIRFIIRNLWRDIPAAANGFANNLIQALSGVAAEAAYDPGLLLWCENIVAEMIRDALPPRRVSVDVETLAHVMFMAFDGFAVNLHLQRGERCTDAAIELFCDFLLGRQD
ncbi:MAG: TetR/AcrR family transcriptional regulator [Rhodospirillales bacterium]|nr:TetR/AcrR family transcriptional regulator [Rhodospirillales bacterium]